ncbi:MAG TPA: serine O-acetyltransferase [Candidatus Binatia bacterium]|nr:serine O-acetyltransferase [Candidatus Binatia bacterium]
MLARLREDIDVVLRCDPAATNRFHVALFWPGLHAIWAYRLAHRLWTMDWKLAAHAVAYVSRAITGVEIHPAACIGPRFFIDHGMGVVIGETAEIGADVMLYHGVTLGGVSSERGKRHPTVEDEVVIGAGAKVLGAIRIGKGSRIGANAVVVRDVDAERVVVGVPGRAVVRHEGHHPQPDLHHDELPDVVENHLRNVRQRLERLEKAAKIDPRTVPEPDYYL